MIHLTNREKQVLHLISEEYSNSMIAQKLNLSKSSVDKYRRNLLWKFQVKNAAGLIRKAYDISVLPFKVNQVQW